MSKKKIRKRMALNRGDGSSSPPNDKAIQKELPRGLNLANLWKAVLALATLVALIVGIIQIWDRAIGIRPKISSDLSTTQEVLQFIEFMEKHDGEEIELDISCVDNRQSSCMFDVDPTNKLPFTLIFLFSGDRCFDNSNEYTKLFNCKGATALWFPDKADSDSVIATGRTGAGSYIIRGRFVARDMGFGGAVFPENIRNFKITAK